jgi:hypothetical protein
MSGLVVHVSGPVDKLCREKMVSRHVRTTPRGTPTVRTNGAADQADFPDFIVHATSQIMDQTVPVGDDTICPVCDQCQKNLQCVGRHKAYGNT